MRNKAKIPALKGTRCYLGGPIEHGRGRNWRKAVEKQLVEEFEIDLFDPFDDPKQQWAPTLHAARKVKDFATMRRIAKKFVRKDLAIVDRSDFIISCLPYKVPTCGSTHEIIESNVRKKPTLLVCPQGKEYLPYWYFGFIPDRYMFASWDDLYAYLRRVNAGKCTRDDRWAFTYRLI